MKRWLMVARLHGLPLYPEQLLFLILKARGGVLPYKSDGGTRWKISRTPLNGTNSTTTNYITGTANFNSNKDNFRTLSSQ